MVGFWAGKVKAGLNGFEDLKDVNVNVNVDVYVDGGLTVRGGITSKGWHCNRPRQRPR